MTRSPAPIPAALAPLYGREHDLACVLALIREGHRLITLRGPGGIGKTALALHLASAIRSEYDHVVVLDLSALHDPAQVLAHVAAALPIPERSHNPIRDIQGFAADHRTLLLLDNFEQVVPAGVALGDVLTAAPLLQVVVTSRAALHLHDEYEYPVLPLALPGRMSAAPASPAVQLFVRRVQAVQPSFTLSAHNTAQVMRLCDELEGVPLALELAAARLRTYSLADLLDRLSSPLQVLRADFRDRPERLRSLRAAVEWSYALLSEDDRAVFECCAVFEGALTPGALAAVWGSDAVLERMDALLEQSFVQRLETPDTRWKMLQPLRELALEHLPHRPDVAAWRERHAAYFLALLETSFQHWQSTGADGREAFLPHYPNIRAGLVWATAHGRADLAYRYLFQIGMLWVPLGLHAREAPLAARVLALPAPTPQQRVKALHVGAECLRQSGQRQAYHARLDELVALCAGLGDFEGAAWARLGRADLDAETGRSAQALEARQAVVQECASRWMGPPAIRLQQTLWANALLSAAQSLLDLGRASEALAGAREAQQRFQVAGNAVFELEATLTVAQALQHLRRGPEAQDLLMTCLDSAIQKGFRGVVRDIVYRALLPLAADCGALSAVVQFAAFSAEPDQDPGQDVPDRRVQDMLTRARDTLGHDAFREAWDSGRGLRLPDIAELASPFWASADPGRIAPPASAGLTPREREVLALVAQGLPDRKIAQRLGISPGTASKHVGNLLGKVGVRNRVELTRWALDHVASGEGAPRTAPR